MTGPEGKSELLLLHTCEVFQLRKLVFAVLPEIVISQVNNVIDPFKYTEVPFGSKSELKEYLKVRCLLCKNRVTRPLRKPV